jgi:hypothetical protein
MRFEPVETNQTRVTSRIDYRVPYPLVGWIVDKLYVGRQARKMATQAVEGIKKAAREGKILTLQEQMEKRKADHPGYDPPRL